METDNSGMWISHMHDNLLYFYRQITLFYFDGHKHEELLSKYIFTISLGGLINNKT